jgi:hypothetical protein
MRIIGYTYCADIHCPACTREDAAVGLLTRKPPLVMDTDEHGLAYDLVDREGNAPFPIYDIMEHDFTHCGDCHEELT